VTAPLERDGSGTGSGTGHQNRKDGNWRSIRYGIRKLHSVGIQRDGTLHNPNGYDESDVRAAIQEASDRRHERRSRRAKKAAVTRRERTAGRVYAIAKQLTCDDRPLSPRRSCCICGRKLTDAESIARGIGSECWQDVLDAITEHENAKTRSA
jgi:hypothetical protein